MIYKNKIFYETKYIPSKGYKLLMLFGFIFTHSSENELSNIDLYHEKIHINQYLDCLGLGILIFAILLFTLLIFSIYSWWLLLFILFPINLYYIWYGINFLYQLCKYKNWKKAYKNIIFERQAYKLEKEILLDNSERIEYTLFSFLKY